MQEAHKDILKNGIVLSPYGRHLGMDPILIEVDHVVVAMPFKNDLTTLGDVVHGGAIASLVDVAATGAFWALEEQPTNPRGTTIGFSINYLDAGRAQTLTADAKVMRRGGSICVGSVDVTDETGKQVAHATVTYKLSQG
ncbi:MAG: PaaI family thioesterase [Rhodobiaceae bacterium]|nr:PaaI family thioesterase [Rhodobiaceae bacterium]